MHGSSGRYHQGSQDVRRGYDDGRRGQRRFRRDRNNWDRDRGSNDRRNRDDFNGRMVDSGYRPKSWKPQGVVDRKREELRPVREKLPVFRHRDELLDTVRDNSIVLIVGETGSGKSTQIPQYLIEGHFADTDNKVVCTQPRTVAARSVATRVAEEHGTNLGERVGYSVRLDQKQSIKTVLMYMTEGTLLRIAMTSEDHRLDGYKCVVVDEAHERTVNCDLLMGLLKTIVDKRPDFRVVVMSATLDIDRFARYFRDPPRVVIPGRTHPVRHHFLNEPSTEYHESIVNIVKQIHLGDEEGDILIFLTGSSEIEDLVQRLKKDFGDSKRFNHKALDVLPLYSQLSKENQDRVFAKTQMENTRKCVVSTNVAETSLTIEGVVFVIDSGFSKQTSYDYRKGVESLSILPISKASVKQRAGRAGRTKPGDCFHLYTWPTYVQLRNATRPEILRSSLLGETLSMLALGIDDPATFDYMDPPHELTLARALRTLYELDALDETKVITNVGMKMAQLPLNPRLARALIASVQNDCLPEVLTIAAMIETSEKLWSCSRGRKSDMKEHKRTFYHGSGDHLTYLNIYNAFKNWEDEGRNRTNFNGKKEYCKSQFWDWRTLDRATKVRNQIETKICGLYPKKTPDYIQEKFYVRRFNAPDYTTQILKSLLAGYFTNVAVRTWGDKYMTFRIIDIEPGEKIVDIVNRSASPHHSSAFDEKEMIRSWVMYHEILDEGRIVMRTVSGIDPAWLLEVGEKYYDLDALVGDKSPISNILRLVQSEEEARLDEQRRMEEVEKRGDNS